MSPAWSTLPTRAGIVLLSAAAVVFLLRGGTHVVRGVLEKSDTLPREASARGREDDEVRHGMTIGNLERFLVFTLALLGHLGVLGFVIGVKGLVGAVEWRERPMLEYFLVGTLASVTLALVPALAVRWVALALW